jgi:hypothetical protein
VRAFIPLALTLLPAAAIACPPPPPTAESEAARQQRVHNFKQYATRAPGIVYGVVEEDIGYDEKRHNFKKVGTLRILHVYKGPYKRGQRVRMSGGFYPLAICAMAPMSLRKGAYGVVILDKAKEGQPLKHNGFLPPDMIQQFIAEGIIRSARGDAAGDAGL